MNKKQSAYEIGRTKHRELHPQTNGTGVMLGELRLMPYRDRIRLASVEQLEAHPELSVKPKIYIASKARHRPRWREFRDGMGYQIISRWIDTGDKYIGTTAGDAMSDLDYRQLWRECVQDVRDCDVLVLYVEEGEHLKGALIELGIALGLKKEIIVTGPLGDNGTWHYHDKVEVSDKSIEALMEYIHG